MNGADDRNTVPATRLQIRLIEDIFIVILGMSVEYLISCDRVGLVDCWFIERFTTGLS